MARIEQSIEINVPVHKAYDELTQFEHYPRFMDNVEEVRQLDEKHVHLHAKAGNLDMEWDAEITQQVPNRCIAWRNTSGPPYEGRIELRPEAEDRTRVTLTMECDSKQQILPEHGDAETAIAERTEHDLKQFKKFIERLNQEGGKGGERRTESGQSQDTQDEMAGKTVGRTEAERRDAARSGQEANPAQQLPQVPRATLESWTLSTPWLPGMLQMWDGPLGMMRRITQDMDQVVERFFGRPAMGVALQQIPRSGTWTPIVETAQRDGEFVVCAELAGVRREDVNVEVRNGRLTIEGDRRQEPQHGPQEQRHSERAYGHFYRAIDLPAGADAQAASACLQDGMLEVTVPIRHQQQARKLTIQARH